MIEPICSQDELSRVISLLRENREKCLYLYCNATRYGIDNEQFQLYFDVEKKTVIGIYYRDSLHIYSGNGIDEEIIKFIVERRPRTIFSSHRLPSDLPYDEESTGVYLQKKKSADTNHNCSIVQLEEKDISQLTDFLYTYSSEYQKTYDKNVLESQLMDRLLSGYCRYFGIFKDGKIIACAFTKAEIHDTMIVGGILVNPFHRGKGLAKDLCRHKGSIALGEGKDAYCFIDDMNGESIRLHSNVGYRRVNKVYKYTVKR